MKKTMLLIMITCLLMSAGCAGISKASLPKKELNSSFSSKAEILWKEQSYQAEIQRQEGKWNIAIRNEALQNPVIYQIQNEDVRISSGTLQISSSRSQFPAEAFALLIADILDNAASEQNSAEKKDGNLVVNGKLRENRFQLLLAGNDKNFLHLSVSPCGLSVSFSDFHYL